MKDKDTSKQILKTDPRWLLDVEGETLVFLTVSAEAQGR